jgi:pimeloyl-ACP methyl ester carboxylesterase
MLQHPDRVHSAVLTGCGYGAQPEREATFREECAVIADAFAAEGAAAVAERYAVGPTRVQLQNKDPRSWRRFKEVLSSLSSEGAARTMRGVQAQRPSLYHLKEELARIDIPVLIVVGDEDEGCLEPDLMLKRTIPSAALAMLPRTGHACNLEEPERFNQLVADFIEAVETRAWTARDPRACSTSFTGMDGQ